MSDLATLQQGIDIALSLTLIEPYLATTSALDRHAHEEIDIRDDVPAPHPELFQTP